MAPFTRRHARVNSLYDKIALRDAAKSRRRGVQALLSTLIICSIVLLVWERQHVTSYASAAAAAAVSMRYSSVAKRSVQHKIAFVVLTDVRKLPLVPVKPAYSSKQPREKHEENVIPMLKHVEQKYGEVCCCQLCELLADEFATQATMGILIVCFD